MTKENSSPGFSKFQGLQINGAFRPDYASVLSPDALIFLIELHRKFNYRRKHLLQQRQLVQKQINEGWTPEFLSHTKMIRESKWCISPIPDDLQDRRVEITGPVDRKMIINALNSGAKIFMADFEDSNAPTWHNVMQGQINLRDAINKNISYYNPDNGKEYVLNEKVATLMVRPRGWHLEEKNILIDNEPVSASLVDFGLYFFHNAKKLLANGSGPYFYLPKIENYDEARLWNDVFVFAQKHCNIPYGSIKATVLVETILASFQLNEILWELRDHSAGMNCGRWDYIFSFIKKFRNVPGHIFPDRSQVNMTVPFMRAYTQLVVQTCHKRGAHAIGGMAAQIPVKNDPLTNEKALEKVRADKKREVIDGHDGTWVAHPGLVATAMNIFDEYMASANQINNKREDFTCTEKDLLQVPEGTITEDGLRMNINVGILYIESWLRGIGAAALYNMMEDAATAEISRTQVWQWLKSKARLNDGRIISFDLYQEFRDEEIESIRSTVGSMQYQNGMFVQAICLFNKLVVKQEFEEFLTMPAYDILSSVNENQFCAEEIQIANKNKTAKVVA